ncbi:MAG: hypothetical protein ACOYOP_10395 [Microthrixaceae bacterium]
MTAVRARSAPARDRSAPARDRTAARSRSTATRARGAAPRPRPAARSLPQESTGPRLAVVAAPRTGWRRLLAGAVVLLLAVMGGSVFVQGERISVQERSDRLATQIARADERGRELRVQVATAESPERILDQAAAMGMVEPGPAAAVPAAEPAAASSTAPPVPAGVGPG